MQCEVGEEPTARALAVETTRKKQLEQELELVKEELRAAQETIAAKEEQLVTAEAKSQG